MRVGGQSNRWVYALSSGVCPELRRAARVASSRFEVTLNVVIDAEA